MLLLVVSRAARITSQLQAHITLYIASFRTVFAFILPPRRSRTSSGPEVEPRGVPGAGLVRRCDQLCALGPVNVHELIY